MHTIATAAAAIRAGQLTPVDLLEQCLARIDELEPRVRAWVLVDRDRARADAHRLATELKRGVNRGSLHGIPMGIKDLFDVFDWPTAAGSKRWANSYARQDCPAVAQLRQAGAVFVGKTVTTAYATFDPPPTTNPWKAGRTPGGSSSGSAAAVACGMVPAALGTQTGGSITRPSGYCGVYGLKPTYARVSLDGVAPLSTTLDHGGPIANSVRDCALVLQACGRPLPGRPLPDLTAAMGGPVSKKLAVLGGYFSDQAEPVMKQALDVMLGRLRGMGWQVTARPLPPAYQDVPHLHRVIMASEALRFHEDRWRRHPDDYPPKFTSLLEQGLGFTGAEYARAMDHLTAMRAAGLDWLPGDVTAILPATSGPAPDASTIGEPLFQAPLSFSGLPTQTLPFAWTPDGLPLCVQIVGRMGREDELLGVGAALEADIGFERRDAGVVPV